MESPMINDVSFTAAPAVIGAVPVNPSVHTSVGAVRARISAVIGSLSGPSRGPEPASL